MPSFLFLGVETTFSAKNMPEWRIAPKRDGQNHSKKNDCFPFWAAMTHHTCRILRKDERKLETGKNFIEKSACKHLQFPNRGGMIRVPFRVIDDLFCEFGGGERVDENQVGQNERLTPTNMRINVPLSDEQILENRESVSAAPIIIRWTARVVW